MTPASRPSDAYATRAARYGGAVQRGERGGGTTAAAVVLGCALIGAVAGYATSYAGHQEPAQLPSAVPLAATSPSVPTDPPVHVVPDSDEYAPLGHRPDLRDPVHPPGLGAVAVRRAQRLGASRDEQWHPLDASREPEAHLLDARRPRLGADHDPQPGEVPVPGRPRISRARGGRTAVHRRPLRHLHLCGRPTQDLPTLVLDLEAGLGDRRLRDHGVGPDARRGRVSRRCSTMCWRRHARSS